MADVWGLMFFRRVVVEEKKYRLGHRRMPLIYLLIYPLIYLFFLDNGSGYKV
jgi:hypothetical protein